MEPFLRTSFAGSFPLPTNLLGDAHHNNPHIQVALRLNPELLDGRVRYQERHAPLDALCRERPVERVAMADRPALGAKRVQVGLPARAGKRQHWATAKLRYR